MFDLIGKDINILLNKKGTYMSSQNLIPYLKSDPEYNVVFTVKIWKKIHL